MTWPFIADSPTLTLTLYSFAYFINRFHVLEQFVASSWIGQHIMDCSNITKSNNEAHKLNGIALCILTLIHVWSILLPCVTHKWKAQVVPGSFEYPLSERAPPGFKDADAENQIMSLQVDDIYRMVEMTLLLGVLTPLSIRWMQRCWHLGIQVHRFVAVLYFVDIVRRHSHPHSWVFNTPIFVIWILDKVVSMIWRRIKVPSVISETISPDYIVLYWTNGVGSCSANEIVGVGSKYFMKLYPSSWMEPRHPFTTFKNRSGNCDFLVHASGQKRSTHTNGAVIHIFHNDRKPRIGSQSGTRSHTERIAKACNEASVCEPSLSIWGPFQGKISNLIPKALLNTGGGPFRRLNGKNVVLAGSGSAINFMIDLMSQLSSSAEELMHFDLLRNELKEITFLYSTRDEALYQWASRAMNALLNSIDASSKGIGKAKIRIILACTAKTKKDIISPLDTTARTILSIEDLSYSSLRKHRYAVGSIALLNQRLNYRCEVLDGSIVFCQGSSGFKSVIEAACRAKHGVRLHFDQ